MKKLTNGMVVNENNLIEVFITKRTQRIDDLEPITIGYLVEATHTGKKGFFSSNKITLFKADTEKKCQAFIDANF